MGRWNEVPYVVFNAAIRNFVDEKRFAALVTINPAGSPQQPVMWCRPRTGTIVMSVARGRQKEKNPRCDRQISLHVENGSRYTARHLPPGGGR